MGTHLQNQLPPIASILELAKLAVSDRLVLFGGAGLSLSTEPTEHGRLIRMPLWRDLGERVASEVGRPFSKGDDILELFDFIASDVGRDRLEHFVRQAIPQSLHDPGPLHRQIARIPWHLVVTTNYDNILARALREESPVWREEDFERLRDPIESRPRLVHLHGILQSPHTLTQSDFNNWPERHPFAYKMLESVFLNKTVLFAGYSFSDPHLKNGLLPWIQRITKGRTQHFAWMHKVHNDRVSLLKSQYSIKAHPVSGVDLLVEAFRQLADAIASLQRSQRSAKGRSSGRQIQATSVEEATVNGYKLFFFRMAADKSVNWLSTQCGVSARKLRELERVRRNERTGPRCFRTLDRVLLARVERALGCVGMLEYGNAQGDDFLAKYIMYYELNRSSQFPKNRTRTLDFHVETKAVVFDFGGTLTRSMSSRSTWERMWELVGYTSHDAGHLHRQFLEKRITHQQWCDVTAERLREKGFSRQHLKRIADSIELLPGVEATVRSLRDRGIQVHIVSGSIREIVADVLGPLFPLFSSIMANEITFDSAGLIRDIRGTKFDFEGKARYLKRVAQDLNCQPIEVLFVGNSLNDSWANQSGARTLCVNPVDVDFSNTSIWCDYIREMSSVEEILRFV